MKILLSPTKKQVYNTAYTATNSPKFISKSAVLIEAMKLLGRDGVKELLGISEKLTDDNWFRLNNWSVDPEKGSGALFTYVGEVFSYLDPSSFSVEDLRFLESSLRIFSGLYGILKPMDSIMPYRLDIKDSLSIPGHSSLYSYWREDITSVLNSELNADELLIDLSSKEYSKSVDFKKLGCRVITPDFKSEVGGKLKTVAIWSKRMRGLLTREIILNRIENPEALEKIKLPGYRLEDTHNDNYLYIKEQDK